MTRALVALLTLLLTTALFAEQSPDLIVTLDPIGRPASGTSTTLQATLRNRTANEIRDIDVDFVLEATRGALSAATHPAWPPSQWSCTNLTARHIRCRVPVIAQGPDQFIPLLLTIDPANEGRFRLTTHATWMAGGVTLTSEPYAVTAVFPRELRVINTNDAGEGSLRAAIETANDACARDQVPCLIRFLMNEPRPANGWYSIRPRTPLPPITAPDFEIDGERVGGEDPHIELDGSLLGIGHGLDIRGEGPAMIRGLAIGGFPYDGVTISRRGDEARRISTTIFNSLIGVHPGRTPNPNRSRGITMNAPATSVAVRNNLIGANLRSGVFIAGAHGVLIFQNLIGTFESGSREQYNGASGIFAGPGSRNVSIMENTITGNAHFGLAIARGAVGVNLVNTNRIAANGLLPIDYALDGFSGYAKNGSNPETARTPAPRVTSVQFDAATNTSTVSGTFDNPDPSQEWKIALYIPSAAFFDLPLQTTTVTGNTFAFAVTGLVTQATAMVYADCVTDRRWSTSEMSEAFELR